MHDGDTLALETDQGDWDRKVRQCRLHDVYAPEIKQPGGVECRQFVKTWIVEYAVGKWPLWVDTVQTANDLDVMTFNRFVTVVWNRDRTRQLNAEINAYIKVNGYAGGTGA